MTNAEPSLTFDPETHTYWNGSTELPSVSRVIADLYTWTNGGNEAARDRGTRVHALTEECDAGTLDWFALDDEDAAYVQAWADFKRHTSLQILLSEHRVWDLKRGYAGTLDRYVEFNGERAVIDIKTGEAHAAHGVQLAAYAQALHENFTAIPAVPERFAVYLRPNGQYRLERYSRPDDWPCFLACLAVHNWRQGVNE